MPPLENAGAGRPAPFARLGSAFLCQEKRTATGDFTAGEGTTTALPSILASALVHSLSSPMISNQSGALPSRVLSPSALVKVTRIVAPSALADAKVGPWSTMALLP